MASFTATATAPSAARPALLHRPSVAASASPILALPSMGKRNGGVRCSMEAKPAKQETAMPVAAKTGASMAAAALTAAMTSPAAMALVDERMSTEGTGLPFGLSNNLLGWILFAVFGFIWAFYIVYTSTLEEDEESGLSL